VSRDALAMRLDCVVLVGHSAPHMRQGRMVVPGSAWLDGTSEWAWCRMLAPIVAHCLAAEGYQAEARWRGPERPGANGLAAEITAINALNPRCLIELHTDIGQPHWSAAPQLHWPGSARGQSLAMAIATQLEGAYHQSRRVVAQDKSWDGTPLRVLRDARCPSVIVECHYGSHAPSVKRAHEDPGAIAEAIARGVGHWLRQG